MTESFKVRVTAFKQFAEGEGPTENSLGAFNDNGVLSYAPFNFEQHGITLHKWCNKPYSAKFWDMAGSYGDFIDYYRERQLIEGVEHTIFSINDKPLAFTEIYPIIGSELQQHLPNATDKDFGIHFLMAPPRKIAEEFREIKRGISFLTLRTAIERLFNSGKVDTVYAEPDRENHKACHLAEMAGFSHLRDIQLTDKKASLYRVKKEAFDR